MKNKVIIFAILIVTMASVSAFAQLGKLGIGTHMTLGNSAVDNEDNEYFFGFHARARLSSGFALDGSMEFRTDKLEDGTEVDLRPLQVSGLFYLLPNSKLSLYGLGGIGWSTMSFDFEDNAETDDEETDLSYHIGAGLEIPITFDMVLYGEVRYLSMSFEKLKDLLNRNVDSSGLQYSFGVTLYF